MIDKVSKEDTVFRDYSNRDPSAAVPADPPDQVAFWLVGRLWDCCLDARCLKNFPDVCYPLWADSLEENSKGWGVGEGMFLNLLKQVKKKIIAAISVMMAIVLVLAAVDLGWLLIRDLLFHEPMFILSVEDLLDIFGMFMLVLIGIELLETIVKTYLTQDSARMQSSFHAQVVLSVAIIALARKIIILDLKELPPVSLLGLAALTLSLCVGYYFIRQKPGLKTDTENGQTEI